MTPPLKTILMAAVNYSRNAEVSLFSLRRVHEDLLARIGRFDNIRFSDMRRVSLRPHDENLMRMDVRCRRHIIRLQLIQLPDIIKYSGKMLGEMLCLFLVKFKASQVRDMVYAFGGNRCHFSYFNLLMNQTLFAGT